MTAAARSTLVLDACCVINLFATNRMQGILESLQRPVVVTDYVLNREVLYIYNGPLDNIRSSKERIELTPLLEAGLIKVVTLRESADQELFVSLAVNLDDGEATAAVVAIRQGWGLATDDTRARDFLAAQYPSVEFITTPEIIKNWFDTTQPTEPELQAVIRLMQLRARYRAGPRHPHFQCWQSRLVESAP